MTDIIHLLPDSVANQIAAGEVIQRPASVIKELVENSIDAGANQIKIYIKDAGRTLLQITDNGCGMSETDARMAFERHATSKITSASDLFSIRTKGFRGEALASIAAIAQVNLKTRHTEEEIGTEINIAGSKVTSQEPVNCAKGTNIAIKNLFFNVPARRKFLKSNSTELRHIIFEFQRIALAHPEAELVLIHNDAEIYNLPASNLRQRIVYVFGKHINQNLTQLNTETSIVNVSGFIGKPEFAKKTYGEQFFFINNRYMRHAYFHKAVLKAYEHILPPDTVPSYFIYLEADPETIDVNIHPTKTEIKFEDEQAIFQIIHASTKEALGKFNITPSIDFDSETAINIPVMNRHTEIKPPSIEIDPEYNPFEKEHYNRGNFSHGSSRSRDNATHWEKFYDGFENPNLHPDSFKPEQEAVQTTFTSSGSAGSSGHIQLRGRYILTSVKSGVMIVDQKRAHERILFEKYIHMFAHASSPAQQQLFPESIELDPADYSFLSDILDDVNSIGFDIRSLGQNTVVVYGCPADLNNPHPKDLVEHLIEEFKNTEGAVKISAKERIARSLARSTAIGYGNTMEQEEMRELIDKLFACENPNYSPSGKLILTIIDIDEIEGKLK
ncbi:MAG: DNA mismatch repair endonuclease MutL [Bacteroidales bacterium]|nr:DNA mismatch repair endonuclease MutL [Bacteroidales bacterium]